MNNRKCINCAHSYGGERDYNSDICDSCCNEPDNSLEDSKHFNSEEERDIYYRENGL